MARTSRTLRGIVVRSVTVVALGAGWQAVAGMSAANAAGTPPENGCPTAYQLLSVATLTGQGYHVPAYLDDPANGGNGDGWVCGKPANEHKSENTCNGPCPVPQLYNFLENYRTPSN